MTHLEQESFPPDPDKSEPFPDLLSGSIHLPSWLRSALSQTALKIDDERLYGKEASEEIRRKLSKLVTNTLEDFAKGNISRDAAESSLHSLRQQIPLREGYVDFLKNFDMLNDYKYRKAFSIMRCVDPSAFMAAYQECLADLRHDIYDEKLPKALVFRYLLGLEQDAFQAFVKDLLRQDWEMSATKFISSRVSEPLYRCVRRRGVCATTLLTDIYGPITKIEDFPSTAGIWLANSVTEIVIWAACKKENMDAYFAALITGDLALYNRHLAQMLVERFGNKAVDFCIQAACDPSEVPGRRSSALCALVKAEKMLPQDQLRDISKCADPSVQWGAFMLFSQERYRAHAFDAAMAMTMKNALLASGKNVPFGLIWILEGPNRYESKSRECRAEGHNFAAKFFNIYAVTEEYISALSSTPVNQQPDVSNNWLLYFAYKLLGIQILIDWAVSLKEEDEIRQQNSVDILTACEKLNSPLFYKHLDHAAFNDPSFLGSLLKLADLSRKKSPK